MAMSGGIIQMWALFTAFVLGIQLPDITLVARDTILIILLLLALEYIRAHGAKRGKPYLPILIIVAIYRSRSLTYTNKARQRILFIKGLATLQILIILYIGAMSFIEACVYTIAVLFVHLAIDVFIAYGIEKKEKTQ